MGKKILVTKEFHLMAMSAIESHRNSERFVIALKSFLNTKLSEGQRQYLEIEINKFIDTYNSAGE